MVLKGSIIVNGKRYEVDYNPDSRWHDHYSLKEQAETRAIELRNDGWLVRTQKVSCTEGTEEAYQVFKRKPN